MTKHITFCFLSKYCVHSTHLYLLYGCKIWSGTIFAQHDECGSSFYKQFLLFLLILSIRCCSSIRDTIKLSQNKNVLFWIIHKLLTWKIKMIQLWVFFVLLRCDPKTNSFHLSLSQLCCKHRTNYALWATSYLSFYSPVRLCNKAKRHIHFKHFLLQWSASMKACL